MGASGRAVPRELQLFLAEDLELTPEVVTDKWGIFGQSGFGKTYTLGKLAELLLDLGAQVVLVDTVGKLYGLKSSADGRSAGFPLVIFGGARADVPTTPAQGAQVARAVVSGRLSAIVDVSEFTTRQMAGFLADFLRTLFEMKKRHPSAMHVLFEECHEVFPEKPATYQADMLEEGLRVLKLGRNYGIGWTLASQEPQSVSARARSQIGSMLAKRTIDDFAQRWVMGWARSHLKGRDQLAQFRQALSELDKREAFAVSPTLKVFRRVTILPKRTFDSSRTPEVGESLSPPKVLAAVDVEKLVEAFRAPPAVEDADAPALRARVRELEAQLQQALKPAAKAAGPAPADEALRLRVKELEAHAKQWRWMAAAVPELIHKVAEILEPVRAKLDEASHAAMKLADLRPPSKPAAVPAASQPVQAPARVQVQPPGPVPRARRTAEAWAGGADEVKPGARAILGALASAGHPLEREEVLVRAVLSPSSGSTVNRLAELRAAGLVVDLPDGRIGLADGAAEHAAEVPRPGPELVAAWQRKVGQSGFHRMLAVLAADGAGMTRDELCDAAGVSRISGSTMNRLADLRRLNLVFDEGGRIHLHAALREGAK